jgi:hypothetical protein
MAYWKLLRWRGREVDGELSNCIRVFMSQIGFVAVPVTMPAVTAAAVWTLDALSLTLNQFA